MNRTRALAIVFAVLLAVSIVGPTVALAQTQDPLFVQGQPDLKIDVPDNTVVPGHTSQVELQISNDGEITRGSPEARGIVTLARNVRVDAEMDDDSPIEVETDRQAIGSVSEDDPQPAPIGITVPEGTEPGSYDLDVELEYRYTSQLYQRTGVTNERSRTVTRTVEVEVEDRPLFEITNVTTDAQIGDRGVLEATIENTGSRTATDTRMTLAAEAGSGQSSMLSIGGGQSSYARAGTLEPGEETVLRYDVAVDGDASVRAFSLDGTVQFTDPDGVAGQESGLSAGVTPRAKQQFSFEDVDSTLRVGEEGDIRGTVTNEGPGTADSVVVRFVDQSPNVVPITDSVAVGSLSSGESAEFRLPIELTSEAEAISKNFDMTVAYRNEADERRLFEDIDISADVTEARDEFRLDANNQELSVGSSTFVNVTVTNNLDETVTDVEAKLFTDSPIVSGDDEGYVESLAPGESTAVTFEVSAEASATPRTYPLKVDFRYDDESGTSKVSDTYQTAIDVSPGEDGGIPWLPVVGALVIVAVIGGAVYWRRG